MALIRPRLTDYHNIALAQVDADFAIPFLDEDIPFCLDPFLLFKSPSQQENALHVGLINSFNHLGYLVNKKKTNEASEMLIRASECDEVGLGYSATRRGLKIGPKTAQKILSLFKVIPQIKQNGFFHLEAIQLYIDQIAMDRISDIACTFLKSFIIDYTIDQCQNLGIPINDVNIRNVYDLKTNRFIDSEKVKLPSNPETQQPILLVPKRWLRHVLWINCDDYVSEYYLTEVIKDTEVADRRPAILNFNRQNYDIVQAYIKQKEKTQADCKNDPLFNPVPVLSAKKKFSLIKKLPTGKTNQAYKKYEDYVCQLLASLLYPHLDFATEQVRTDSGVQIRDLIFYNNRSVDFLEDIYKNYESQQLVFELKNVKEIEREDINQLNRYLADEFGKFGVLFTRNNLPKAMFRNTIDLWSGQRRCIIALTDADLELMVNVYESKQRLPIEVLKKKYIEFTRACPV